MLDLCSSTKVRIFEGYISLCCFVLQDGNPVRGIGVANDGDAHHSQNVEKTDAATRLDISTLPVLMTSQTLSTISSVSKISTFQQQSVLSGMLSPKSKHHSSSKWMWSLLPRALMQGAEVVRDSAHPQLPPSRQLSPSHERLRALKCSFSGKKELRACFGPVRSNHSLMSG